LADGRLVIDSPWLLRFGTLGVYRRTVVVDPGSSSITFSTRLFGKTKRRIVSFSDISRLDYRFDETGENTGSAWLGSRDSTEWFTISIVMKTNQEEVMIGRFIGEGSVDYGWESILAGDDAIDFRGDQEERSLGLVKLLQAMLGLPLT